MRPVMMTCVAAATGERLFGAQLLIIGPDVCIVPAVVSGIEM